jgi:uncharacterized membrane protein YhiD involved in acid resistance
MDELVRELSMPGGGTHPVTIMLALTALVLSFVLCSILARAYYATHSGISYSKSFLQTMVLMGVTVAVIMVVIGSNIARAFSLVGALSIVRFRNAVKEPRDVAFIFMAMTIGMACGTGFYVVAILAALGFSLMVRLMARFDFGARPFQGLLLKIQAPSGTEREAGFREVFDRLLESYALISVDSLEGGLRQEFVYEVTLKPKTSADSLIRELASQDGDCQINILPGYDRVDL